MKRRKLLAPAANQEPTGTDAAVRACTEVEAWAQALAPGCGAGWHADLAVGPSAAHGLGVFAARALPPGTPVVVLPQAAVLTARAAAAHPLGGGVVEAAAAVAGHAPLPPPGARFVLSVWMAAGRRCPSHPFHAYLRQLPAAAPDPASWPRGSVEDRVLLAGTPVGGQVARAQGAMDALHLRWVPALVAANPHVFARGDAPRCVGADRDTSADPGTVRRAELRLALDLRWSEGMLRSRGFPPALDHASAAEPEGAGEGRHQRAEGTGARADVTPATPAAGWAAGTTGACGGAGPRVLGGAECGVLLPLVDVLNHSSKVPPMTWRVDRATRCIVFESTVGDATDVTVRLA